MSNQRTISHEEWDELAAGYALNALEPAEEQLFVSHAAACARCQTSINDFALVAAQLGALADDEGPTPSWHSCRPQGATNRSAGDASGIEAEQPVPRRADHSFAPSPRSPGPAPRFRRPHMLAAAAAMLLIVAGAIGWQLGARSAPSPATAALQACLRQPGCHVVPLHDARANGGGHDRAAVIVDAGRSSLVSFQLASAPAGHMYVVWQMPRDGSPVAINTFLQGHQQTPSSLLAQAYGDTAAFAISLEPTGSAPRRPTNIVALGAAAA